MKRNFREDSAPGVDKQIPKSKGKKDSLNSLLAIGLVQEQ